MKHQKGERGMALRMIYLRLLRERKILLDRNFSQHFDHLDVSPRQALPSGLLL
jgi:hypothetical protein